MYNDLFTLLKENDRLSAAKVVAHEIGFSKEFLAISGHQILGSKEEDFLVRAVNNIHARCCLDKVGEPWKICEVRIKWPAISPNAKLVESLDLEWNTSIIRVVNAYQETGCLPSVGANSINRVYIPKGYLDLIMTQRTSLFLMVENIDISSVNLQFFQQPLDWLCQLTTGVSHDSETLADGILLWLGVIRTPGSQFLALPWSQDGIEPKRGFPIRYLDPARLKQQVVRKLFDVVFAALSRISKGCWPNWEKNIATRLNLFLKTQISARLNELASLNQLFAKLHFSAMAIGYRDNELERGHIWEKWKDPLIRQLTFASSRQQDASIIEQLTKKLSGTALFNYFGERTLSKISDAGSFKKMLVLPLPEQLSLLLKEAQLAEVFGVLPQWKASLENRLSSGCFISRDLRAAVGIALASREVLDETARQDFPGPFLESLRTLLRKLEKLKISSYSASLLCLYEVLTTQLLLLIRPRCFVIPRSWVIVHHSRLKGMPLSSPITYRHSNNPELAMLSYQEISVELVRSLCRLVIRAQHLALKMKKPSEPAMVEKAVHIIAISIENMRGINPLPPGYDSMLELTAEVFLRARIFERVPPTGLLQALRKSFTAGYCGRDEMNVLIQKKGDDEKYGSKEWGSIPKIIRSTRGYINIQFRTSPRKLRIIAAFYYVATMLSPALQEKIKRECALKESHQAALRPMMRYNLCRNRCIRATDSIHFTY
ncbi:hypothetical protein FPQ18DRAFT_167456 [Pyronema domesticum]|nr:hypothetical protein FPQ18DRAFT_167456 [Pyronema domesticum]